MFYECFIYRLLSYDVTAAILMHKNKDMAAILVYRNIAWGIALNFQANISVCFIKSIWPLVTPMTAINLCNFVNKVLKKILIGKKWCDVKMFSLFILAKVAKQ